MTCFSINAWWRDSGNVYKSELLFLAGVHPDMRHGPVGRDGFGRALITAHWRFLSANVAKTQAEGIRTYSWITPTTG